MNEMYKTPHGLLTPMAPSPGSSGYQWMVHIHILSGPYLHPRRRSRYGYWFPCRWLCRSTCHCAGPTPSPVHRSPHH